MLPSSFIDIYKKYTLLNERRVRTMLIGLILIVIGGYMVYKALSDKS